MQTPLAIETKDLTSERKKDKATRGVVCDYLLCVDEDVSSGNTRSEKSARQFVREQMGFEQEMEDLLFLHLSCDRGKQRCPWKTSVDFEREWLNLTAEEERLKTAASILKRDVLFQDFCLLGEIEKLKFDRDLLQKSASDNLAEKASLENQRYQTLVQALDSINLHLEQIYGFLTSGEGDAHCHFAKNPSLLFREGVDLYCK